MRIFKKIKSLIATDRQVREALEQQKRKRADLDKRLHEIQIATLNGEWDWFLHLSKVDPDCAVRVIRECKDDNNH